MWLVAKNKNMCVLSLFREFLTCDLHCFGIAFIAAWRLLVVNIFFRFPVIDSCCNYSRLVMAGGQRTSHIITRM